MTVHCVQVMTSNDADVAKVQNKIDDLKSKYGEKVAEDNHSLKQRTTSLGTNYYIAEFRVILSDKDGEKKSITDEIAKEAEKSASWYVVRWHECGHDGTAEDCGYIDSNGEFRLGFETLNSGGSVPRGVSS